MPDKEKEPEKDKDPAEEILSGPVENFSRNIVDNNNEENARSADNKGLEAKIVRTTDGNCCQWCTEMAGEYEYSPNMDTDVFRRHDNCECEVEYVCEKGRQDVWSKKWKEQNAEEKNARIDRDKKLGRKLILVARQDRAHRLKADKESKNAQSALSSMLRLAKDGDIFVNRSDELHDRAKKIKPIAGYRDFVCHADQYGFAFLDKNGKESNVSVKEFCDILDASGNYHGEKIRLLACQAGAGDAIIPRYIAKRYDTEVMAPTEDVCVDFDGNFILANDPDKAIMGIETGKWRRFDKNGEIK